MLRYISYISVFEHIKFLKLTKKKQTGTGKASYQTVISEKGKEWLRSRGKK